MSVSLSDIESINKHFENSVHKLVGTFAWIFVSLLAQAALTANVLSMQMLMVYGRTPRLRDPRSTLCQPPAGMSRIEVAEDVRPVEIPSARWKSAMSAGKAQSDVLLA